MLAICKSATIIGIEAKSVQVEVEVKSAEKQCFILVGLADTAVRESKERVIAALSYAGFKIPGRILVNLAPAEIKKEGSNFDLAIAVGILAASRQIKLDRLTDCYIHGELALDGSIKPIKGAAALSIEARSKKARYILLPEANAAEASLIEGIEVIPLRHISEVKTFLQGELQLRKVKFEKNEPQKEDLCLSEVYGQETVKRALTIAAAGAHNILMIGPPGCGKSMLAARFAEILPPLTVNEKLEVVKIHSSAGLPIQETIRGKRPFRAPHHVVSEVGLIGGGGSPRPGEISLAHNGVLFLDEFPEYRRGALEAMRAPLEDGKVQITRAKASVNFPSKFQLIAAMNPCPRGGPCDRNTNCKCSPHEVRKYLGKLSEPILDRIDLHIELNPVPLAMVAGKKNLGHGESSADIKTRVINSRNLAYTRQAKPNSALRGSELNENIGFSAELMNFIERHSSKLKLSARGFIRCLRVARTIADLEQSEEVTKAHAAEAFQYRSLERLNQMFN
ncbi:MAG: YifB family Mg chelatase-like AAA ATPase [Bdellovibrionota bacterium]